ncbi:MAG: MBG domain-containing protein [Chitinophagaceae bacterium]
MKRYIHLSLICAFTFISSVIHAQDANGILYVKKGGAGTLSGNNWANAIAELGTALQNARTLNGTTPGTVKQIWVAAGTYTPMYQIDGGTTNANLKAFTLAPNVKLYGHFAGTETSTAARVLTSSNNTILSGNLGSSVYSYHVVFATGSLGSDALVDGFTVQEGLANGAGNTTVNNTNIPNSYGGGIALLNSAACNFSHMVIANNYALSYGGGIFAFNASNIKLDSSEVSSNSAGNGGGVAGYTSSITVTNGTIKDNYASTVGGGIYAVQSSPLVITNSLVQTNSSSGSGGGIYTQSGSPITATRLQVRGNSASAVGGGICVLANGSVCKYNNVLLSGNLASSAGGGIYLNNETSQFTNVTIAGNKAGGGGAIYNDNGSGTTINNSVIYSNNTGIQSTSGSVSLQYSLVQGVSANASTHVLDGSTDPLFTNDISYNTAATTDGNYTLQSGSVLKNAGSNALYSGLSASTTDLGGNTRVSNYANGGTIDIGAYELQLTAQSINASNITKTYGAADFAPGFTATSGLTVSYTSADNSIAEAYQDASDGNKWKVTIKKAGSVQITASQAGNATYDGASVAFTLTIAKATLNIAGKDSTKNYDGTTFYGGNGVSYTGFVNNEDSAQALTGTLTYGGSAQGKVNAGAYNMTPGGLVADNYNINFIKGNLTIKKVPLTITARDSTKVYNGTAFSGGNGLKYLGFVNNEDSAQALTGAVTYSGTSQSATGAGTYTIIPAGLTAANYTITFVSGSLTIQLAYSANGIIYVKKGSTGAGSSWPDAVGEVSEALRAAALMNAASAGTVKQIWVAKGTYLPMYLADNVTEGTATTTDRTNAFVLLKDVKIYGGFAGTETDTAARDFTSTANASILSGDLGTAGDISDNAFHVLLVAGNMGNAILSGFTVTGGNANTTSSATSVNGYSFSKGYGGGISIGGTTTLFMEDMIFSNNIGYYGGAIAINGSDVNNKAIVGFSRVNLLNNNSLSLGGAMYTAFCTLDIDSTNVRFNTCTGNYGGGMFVSYASNVNAIRLHVNDNRVTGSSSVGGGIYVSNLSVVNMTNSELLRDTATASGALLYENSTTAQVFKNVKMSGGYGGSTGSVVYCSPNTNLTFINTLITGNKGVAVYIGSGTHNFINTTISGNGTGIYPFGGTLNIQNSIIYGNTTQGIQSGSATVNSKYSTIQSATDDATNHITSADPLFKSPSANTAPFTDGDYSLQGGSPAKNAGNDALYTAVADYPTTDLSDSARFIGTIDQGAYEAPLLQSQTITALADTAVTYGDVFTRIFSAGSGLAVTVASADNNIAEAYQDAADGNQWKIKTKKVGTVNITVSQPGNASYEPAANVTFALTVNTAVLTITAKDSSKVYNGIAYSSGNGVTYSGFVNGDDSTAALTGTLTYSGTSQGAKNVNTYVITPGGLTAGNYTITYNNGTLTINKASLTVTAKDSTKTYDGVAYGGGNGIVYSGFVNNEDSTAALTGLVAYSGTSQGAKNVNTYVITPAGLSAANYAITYVNGSLTITKVPLRITAKDSSKVYDGVAFSGGNGVIYSGFVNGEDSTAALTGTLTYSGTSQGSKNVGTYVIIPGGLTATNYTITYVGGTLTTGMAALTVTAKDSAKVYDGVAYSGGNGLSYSGFVNNEDSATVLTGTVTYSGTSQGAVHRGNYAITPGGLIATNYTITYVNGTLTINKATLSVTADAQTKVYGSADPALTYTATGLAGSDNTSLITGALTRDAGEDAGVYAITQGTLSASADYTIAYTGNYLTITKTTNTITFTTQTAGATISKVYGSAGLDASATATSGLTVTYSSSNTAVATVTSSGQVQIVGAGTTTITASQAGNTNYNAATDVSFTLQVTPASLIITANGYSKTYNAVAYSGGNGIVYSGFVNNETATVLTGTLSYSGTSQGAKAAGSYVITPGGYTSANYSISYLNGTLTISPAALTIQANAQTKVYGTSDPTLTYTATGFAGSDNTSLMTGVLSRDAGENVGTYAINQNTLSAGGNYTISYTGNTFTITKATQTITWVQGLTTGCNGAAAITLTATSNSGLATTYSVDNTAIATVNGSTLTPVSVGSTIVTATQAGDANHFAATAVTNMFNYLLPSMVRQHWSDALFFDNTGGTYVQWQWYKNNTAVTGATSAYYTESTALNGTYYAMVTDQNGKRIQTCPLTLTGSSTVAGGIKVYPNPVNPAGTVTITCNYTTTELQGARLSLTTINGITLQQLTSVQTSNRFTMPVQSGIYVVTLLLSNGQKTTANVFVN